MSSLRNRRDHQIRNEQMEVPVQTPKLNVLTTFQELCLRSNLHKRAFRIPTIVESLSWGEVIAQEMSLEPTFQLMKGEIHRATSPSRSCDLPQFRTFKGKGVMMAHGSNKYWTVKKTIFMKDDNHLHVSERLVCAYKFARWTAELFWSSALAELRSNWADQVLKGLQVKNSKAIRINLEDFHQLVIKRSFGIN